MTFHRDRQPEETLNTRNCRFCERSDPDFAHRKFEDTLVRCKGADTAARHLTEDGHVLHRITELAVRMTSQRSMEHEDRLRALA